MDDFLSRRNLLDLMMAEFVKSEKGKPMLLVDGHLFVKDKKIRDKTYWKCHKFSSYCKCRAITVNEDVTISKEHNHSADPADIEVRKFMEKVKDDAKHTRDSPHYIISTAASNLSEYGAQGLPTVNSIKRSIRKVRAKENCGLSTPSHRMDIVFSIEYMKTFKNDDFLLFDSGMEEERILIFSTYANLDVLTSCQHLFCDGTFKTVPTLFEQLYTIHGLKNGFCIPLIFALLPNKKEETYVSFLRSVKELARLSNIDSITTDFEQAMIKASKNEFSSVKLYGCFFHLGQCLYRKLCNVGLKIKYDTDVEFSMKIRMLLALAFIPEERVVETFEQLAEQELSSPELLPVIDYFEDTWLGRPGRRNARRAPLFAINIWSCFERVKNDLPKTNNLIEGWHRAFSQQVGAAHPSLWKFIDALKREQSLTEIKIAKLNRGEECERSTRKYKESANRLKKIVDSFEEYEDEIKYLRTIAHNLRL